MSARQEQEPENNEDILREVEDIIGEENRSFSLQLMGATVWWLRDELLNDKVEVEVRNKMFERNDSKGEVHPESMTIQLLEKVNKSLNISNETSGKDLSDEDLAALSVAIELNEREIDFINGRCIRIFQHARLESTMDYGSSKDMEDLAKERNMNPETLHAEYVAFWKGAPFDAFTRASAVFRDLNRAVVEAGGTPHPEFTKIFQG